MTRAVEVDNVMVDHRRTRVGVAQPGGRVDEGHAMRCGDRPFEIVDLRWHSRASLRATCLEARLLLRDARGWIKPGPTRNGRIADDGHIAPQSLQAAEHPVEPGRP